MTASMAERAEAKQALFAALGARFGARFSQGQSVRVQNANTLTWRMR
jgi:hypothetical protein